MMTALQPLATKQQTLAPMRNPIQCASCRAIYESQDAQYGKGRQYGQHPEHKYCPKCGVDLDWYGWRYVSAEQRQAEIKRDLAALRGRTAVA